MSHSYSVRNTTPREDKAIEKYYRPTIIERVEYYFAMQRCKRLMKDKPKRSLSSRL